MDRLDKNILQDLTLNCRVTYESLADKYNLTANAIRKRVLNLIEDGVIENFWVYLSPAMISTEHAFLLLTLESPLNEELKEQLNQIPNVILTGFFTSELCSVYADYEGNNELARLVGILSALPQVTALHTYPIIIDRGGQTKFSERDVSVLRCLVDDARMSYSEIASITEISLRAIRSIIQKFIDDESIRFSITWNPNASKKMAYMEEIKFDLKQIGHQEIVEYLDAVYGEEFCRQYCMVCSTEPVLFSVFLVDSFKRVEEISRELRKHPGVNAVKTHVPYPTKKLGGLRRKRLLELVGKGL